MEKYFKKGAKRTFGRNMKKKPDFAGKKEDVLMQKASFGGVLAQNEKLPGLFAGVRATAIAYAFTASVFVAVALLLTYTELSEGLLPYIAGISTVFACVISGRSFIGALGHRALLGGISAGGRAAKQ